MDKNKRNKIIGLSIGILVVLIIVVSSTYAYWQITKTQKTPNDIVAACLDITMENETGTFGLDKAWPISDSEGEALTGYTFEVKNNCDENVNYIVGLNSVEGSSDNYLDYSSLRLKLDDKESSLISDFGDIGYSDPENKEVVRDSKLLSMESLEGGGTNTHNVKVWIDKDAPVTEQGKTFSGQVFITGGQGVPIYDDCFAINTDGAIMGYDYSCGYAVEVPATIAGIEVKTINQASFAAGNMQLYMLYNEDTEEEKVVYYYTGKTGTEDFINFAKQNMCEDPTTCTLEDIENNTGIKIITTEEEYNAIDWDGYTIDGPMAAYFNSEKGEIEEVISQVTSLDLSKAVYLETIGANAFGYNKNLENVILPSDGVLTTIGGSSFAETNLTEITIPSSVVTIGESAFNGGRTEEGKLQKVVFENSEEIPSKLETIGEEAFYRNQIASIDLPFSVKSIESRAFTDNEIFTLAIENSDSNPSKLTNVGSSAFSGNDINNIILPDSVTTIGSYAFSSNGVVDTLVLGKGLSSIGTNAFGSLQIDEATIAADLSLDGIFSGSTISSVTIANNVKTIDGLSGLSIKDLTLEDTTDKPSQLTTIAEGAFSSNQITSVTIPSKVTYLGGFGGNSLTNITIPNSVETIGNSAFANNKITEVTIPKNVSSVGTSAFINNGMTSLNFDTSSSLSNIGESAFENNKITTLTIPASTTYLGNKSFNNNRVNSLTFEDSSILENIGEFAFSCNKLTEVSIPNTVTNIGNYAFSGTLTTLGYKCTDGNELSSVIIEDTTQNPSALTNIGDYAFWYNNLTKIVIPGSIRNIGIAPFMGNFNFSEIIIKKADSSGISFGANANYFGAVGASDGRTAKITYDPDYTE